MNAKTWIPGPNLVVRQLNGIISSLYMLLFYFLLFSGEWSAVRGTWQTGHLPREPVDTINTVVSSHRAALPPTLVGQPPSTSQVSGSHNDPQILMMNANLRSLRRGSTYKYCHVTNIALNNTAQYFLTCNLSSVPAHLSKSEICTAYSSIKFWNLYCF